MIDTLNVPAREEGVVLFDGSSIDNWTKMDGAAAEWLVADGSIQVVPGTGDTGTFGPFTSSRKVHPSTHPT